MAKTAAERQREFRAKRQFAGPDGNGEREIKAWVSTNAYLTFKRLAERYGITNRDLLEKIIRSEEEKVLKKIGNNRIKREKYLFGPDVTT